MSAGATILLLLYGSGVLVPSAPGLDHTAQGRMHYRASRQDLHYQAQGRPHHKASKYDLHYTAQGRFHERAVE